MNHFKRILMALLHTNAIPEFTIASDEGGNHPLNQPIVLTAKNRNEVNRPNAAIKQDIIVYYSNEESYISFKIPEGIGFLSPIENEEDRGYSYIFDSSSSNISIFVGNISLPTKSF